MTEKEEAASGEEAGPEDRDQRHRGTESEHAGTSKQRVAGADRNVWFDGPNEYFDDVLVILLEYDERAVKTIRALPSWARHRGATSEVWRIHPGYPTGLRPA
jgi:hypothetical protein